MNSFSIIQQKLEQFTKKYYTSELIKGTHSFFRYRTLIPYRYATY